MSERILWAVPAGGDARRIEMGVFEKELVRVGRWVHPARKFVLEVTRERLARWARAFAKMTARGIRVPVPYGHSYDARDNAGFVREMRVEGDRLIGVLEIPREVDAARIGATATDVSVSINPDYVDGQGESIGEAIEHVAITNYPVVAGQANFVPVACAAGEGVEVVALERVDSEEVEEAEDDPAADSDPQRTGSTGGVPASADCGRTSAPGELPTACSAADRPSADTGSGASCATLQGLASQPHSDPVTLASRQVGTPPHPDPLLEGEGFERAQLAARVARLEEERIDREVEALLLEGRISPAVEGSVRRLLAAGERIQLTTGDAVAPAEELRAILAAIPPRAWVPLEERAASARVRERRDFQISDERARALGRENARLAGKA